MQTATNDADRGATQQRPRDPEGAFADLLTETRRRGFYGTVSLTLHVQDGFVQQMRVASERIVR